MASTSQLSKVLERIFVNTNKADIHRDFTAYKSSICFALCRSAADYLNVPIEAFEQEISDDDDSLGCWAEIKTMPSGSPAYPATFTFGINFLIYHDRSRVRDVKLEIASWFGDHVISRSTFSIYDTDNFDVIVTECLDEVPYEHPLFKAWRKA